MRQPRLAILVLGLFFLSSLAAASKSRLVPGETESDLVPSPVGYFALLPPEYDEESDPFPLVLNLHGGGGDRSVLQRQKPMFDELWQEERIHPMVIVTPSVTPRSFYVDRKDGSERWESFILGPFLEHLRETYNVRRDQKGTFITGISMGGMGSLRMAFKHPERFGVVAAMEPGIEPVLEWKEIRPKHRFWRSDELMQEAYGTPIDEEHFAANNPATIVTRNADAIRSSGLVIFLEAGDEDMFWLYEGTEFLHQILWDHKIRHEYRLYYGADHVGPSLGWRTRAAYEFMSATLDEPETDRRLEMTRQRIDPLKARLSEADHYGVDDHLVNKEDAP